MTEEQRCSKPRSHSCAYGRRSAGLLRRQVWDSRRAATTDRVLICQGWVVLVSQWRRYIMVTWASCWRYTGCDLTIPENMFGSACRPYQHSTS